MGVVLPGDADAAVDLDHLRGHLLERLGAMDLGHPRVERARDRREVGRARRLHEHEEVGHPVLQRLEAADRPSKLDARLGVFDSDFQGSCHRAHLFGGQRDEGVGWHVADRPGQAGDRTRFVHGGQRIGMFTYLDELAVDEREHEVARQDVALPGQRRRERARGNRGKVPFVAGPQEGLCGDDRLEHGGGAEYPAELLENHARLGHCGSRAAEALRHEQPGDADLVTQPLPRVGLAQQAAHRVA
jgi:hypothetical protein